ncbi:MAG: hypothetical protein H8D45_17750 [Bacteroidetes bacterium]|nr:hypothetical protein [Bacteroidota bacterium]MBL7103205.1 hypothetical protein [Bacteroidales bacterium]
MTLYKNKYRIEPDRCQFWDYSSPGSYFITVCVQNKEHLLGKIKNGQMILSDKGEIVAEFFLQLPSWHKRIILDEWIVMPNHFHCLIILGDFDFDNGGGVVDVFVEKIHEFSLQKHQQRQPQQSITHDTQSRIQNPITMGFRGGTQKQKILNHYRKIDNPTIT